MFPFIFCIKCTDEIVHVWWERKKKKQLNFFWVGRRAAEDTGRSGNVKTKTTSREGMLVSCWANPSWKKGENVESEGKREEIIRWQRKVPGFGQKWKGLPEKKILFPFTGSSLTFTCFLSMALGCSLFSLVVRLVSVQLSRRLELMRQLYCLRGEVL